MNTVAELGLDERGGGDVDSAFGSLSSSQVRTLTLSTELGQAIVLGMDMRHCCTYICVCVVCVCVWLFCLFLCEKMCTHRCR